MKQPNVSYGLTQGIIEMYRLTMELGDRTHNETMQKLKEWYIMSCCANGQKERIMHLLEVSK